MVSIAGNAADTAPLGRRRAEAAAAQERPFGPKFMTPMIGVVVLLMTVLDRHLARADREPDHSGRTARGR